MSPRPTDVVSTILVERPGGVRARITVRHDLGREGFARVERELAAAEAAARAEGGVARLIPGWASAPALAE